MPLPEIHGVVSPDDIRATAATIAEVQERSGAIPWFPGGHTDPWDHVESAMALDVAGHAEAAERAYAWLGQTQRENGSWVAAYRDGEPCEEFSDTNFCGYVAVGTWHHHLVTGRSAFTEAMWPVVRRALDHVIALQRPGGEIAWAQTGDRAAGEALLTSSSSLYQSLRAGLAIAQQLGDPMPDWELAAGRLGHAVRCHPERFDDKRRWSMDWYYPVLGGAVRGVAACRRLERRWEEFWVPGLGVRCVADRPWVTGAETCELALALHATGDTGRAVEVFTAMQHLRDPDGSYWTGYVFDDAVRWPVERSTWTAAAVILAADALAGATPGAAIFRGDGLPVGVDPASVVCRTEVDADALLLCDAAQQP